MTNKARFTFTKRLAIRVAETGSNLCVGIDPDPLYYDVRAEELYHWCIQIVEAIHDKVPACKLQLSFFEQYGGNGIYVAERVITSAKEMGLITILDYKRGDVPHVFRSLLRRTMDSSEDNPFGSPDAVTINPFVTLSGLFRILDDLKFPGKCIFISTNPYGEVSGAIPGALMKVADAFSDELVLSMAEYQSGSVSADSVEIGLVSSCLFPHRVEWVARMFSGPLLIPGFGAQNGSVAADFLKEVRARALISASRSVVPRKTYCDDQWRAEIRANVEKHNVSQG